MKEKHSTEDTIKALTDFREKRNWKQFHNPKDLALALSVEASELLEIFSWKHSDEIQEFSKKNAKEIEEELADVLTYAYFMCDRLGVDPADIVMKKLKKTQEKYPEDSSRDVSSNKYQ
ncbi:nucleotide pyrophosphohydrolase [Patescibacteria group bacterium]